MIRIVIPNVLPVSLILFAVWLDRELVCCNN